ncbi:uncharacterized protein METZ01_LOCUS311659 [marine metagenome]|uniref:Uncharacterized protein n=1 Tax=marine metagenome TaxID=408172 RepID=A0A382NEQ5_9ZZZZ
MATETIYLDCRIDMTAATELSRLIYRNIGPIICLGCMTVHATHQAMSFRSHAQVHRNLSVVHQVLEVITAHDICRFYTVLTLPFWI